MTSYRTIHEASLDQLLYWWDHPGSLEPDFSQEELMDEVAYALTEHGDAGVPTLKRHLYDDDTGRRNAALSALSWPKTDDAEIRSALHTAYESSDGSTRYTALWGFIHLEYFPLSEAHISGPLTSDDERMAALAMVYLSRAHQQKAASLLRDGLRSSNRYKRSYACDEIGDRYIIELASDMSPLLQDSVAEVRQAAQSNLEFFCEELAASRDARPAPYSASNSSPSR